MTGPLPRIDQDPNEEFTGAGIRRLTARVTRTKAGAGPGELLTDVAYAVVSALIAAMLIAGIANALRLGLAPPADVESPDPRWIQAVACAAITMTALGLAIRIGPLGISRAGVAWWLPLPVDRAGLLAPSWWRAVVLWPLACGGLATFASAVAGVGSAGVASGAAFGAASGLLAVAVAGLAQPSPTASARLAFTADFLVAAVPVVGILGVLDAVPLPAVVFWWLAGCCFLAAIGAVTRWRRRYGGLSAPILSARAGVADRMLASTLTLDTKELGRSLSGPTRTIRRRRTLSYGWVRGPVTALVAADTTLLGRSSAALAQIVGLIALMLFAQQIPALATGPVLFVLLVVVGFRGGQLGAAGARTAEMAPTLDALVPLSARWTRAARCIVPASVGALVTMAGTGPLALRWGPGWIVLAAISGAVLGLAAIRSAYRTPPDWSAPLMATPGAGALPTGAMLAVARGPDAALLGCVPLGVVLVTGHLTGGLVAAQLIAAGVVAVVATHVPARR